MHTIYKYSVPILDSFEITLPGQGKILAFQVQDGTPVIWVLVDTENEPEKRRFSIRGTGNSIPMYSARSDTYIGTAQKEEFGFVWHLFEVIG